jgi:uncharacterized protein YukE
MTVNSAEGSTNQLKTDDRAVQSALDILSSHVSFMNSMNQSVQTIQADIASCYQAQSSTTFQSKINEWIDSYLAVQKTVQTLQENLGSAHQVIGRAEEGLTQSSGAWNTTDGSDPIFHALNG